MKNPKKIVQDEEKAIQELHAMLKDKDAQFKQTVLDTVKGMTLMHDHYKKTG